MEKDYMTALDLFRDTLKQLNKNLIQLVELENQKYEALRQVDVKKLMNINSIEEELIQQSDVLENKRIEAVKRVASALNFDYSIKLSEMITYFPLDKQTEFVELRKDMNKYSHELQITMRENSRMIKTNLDIVNFTLNFAKGNAGQSTYDYREQNQSEGNIYIVDRLA